MIDDMPIEPDWAKIRERFIGLDESLSVKSYYPQLQEHVRKLQRERRNARESAAQLNTLFRSLPFAFWSATKDGKIILANDIAHYRYALVPGTSLFGDSSLTSSCSPIVDDFKKAIGGESQFSERQIFDSDGFKWIQAIVAPIVVDDSITGVLGVDVDITKLKQAEESLASLNRELESKVLERTQRLEATIAELTKAQNQLVLSEKFATLGRLTAGLTHELNSPLGAIESASSTISQSVVSTTSNFLAFLKESDPESIASFVDYFSYITDRASSFDNPRNRSRRREASRRLEEMGIHDADYIADTLDDYVAFDRFDALLQRFGAKISSNMTRISADSAAIVRSAAIIRLSAERAAIVVKALKYLEEMEKGGTSEDEIITEVNIDELVASTLELYRGRMHRGVQMVLDLKSKAKLRVDRSSLGQVFVNIINNALQAMEFRGTLSVTTRHEGDQVAIEIGDTGTGIDSAIQERIFEPFFTTKPLGEGTGFGLVVSKRIVEHFGGSIAFESRPGNTIFRISLPAIPGEEVV